jgi:hypothetical protein
MERHMTTPFQKALDELRRLGLVLQQAPGHYRVNFRDGTSATEYHTEDLEDALQEGRRMAADPPPRPEPPLGPTAARSRRRAFMFAHNNRIAAIRRKRRVEGRG